MQKPGRAGMEQNDLIGVIEHRLVPCSVFAIRTNGGSGGGGGVRGVNPPPSEAFFLLVSI